MAADDIPADIARMSFEEALAELEAIVQKLETGESRLDEAVAAYERGAALRRHCEAKLAEAQQKVERIVASAEGAVRTEPLDED